MFKAKDTIEKLIPLAEKHVELLRGYKGWIEGDPNEIIPDWYAKLPNYELILEEAKKLIEYGKTDNPNQKL